VKRIAARQLLVGSLLLVACTAGVVGKKVRPEDTKAADALNEPASNIQCTSVPPIVEPLVVDWRSTDQLDLAVQMQSSIAIVSYDCKSIRLLKNCTAPGKYAYAGVSSVIQEAVQMDDADEVRASLPLSGVSLSAELKRGATLDIALAYVGKQSTLTPSVAATDLSGPECAQATHFVRRATIGAFAMQTGTVGVIRAAAEIFGAGAAAGSSSKQNKLNSAGEVQACKPKEGAEKAPEGCGAILRLELHALGEPMMEDNKAPLPNTCPDGFAPSGLQCVKLDGGKSTHRCDMTDPQECKDLCKRGDADSCYNAGTIAQSSEPKPVTKAFYAKACAGNVARACFALTDFVEKMPDWKDAWAAGEKACNLGLADACAWMGRNGDNGGLQQGIDARAGFYKRACDLGKWESCKEVAEIWLEGKWNAKRHTNDALDLLVQWCDAGNFDACRTLSVGYREGKPYGDPTELRPDAKKSEAFRKKACATKDQRRLDASTGMTCS
jgi:uncharacterized protein